MAIQETTLPASKGRARAVWDAIRRQLAGVPLLSWLLGAIVAAGTEHLIGYPLSRAVGMGTVPPIFGVTFILKAPAIIPGILFYALVVYLLPTLVVAKLSAGLANRVAAWLLRYPVWVSALVHLGVLYASMHLWGALNDYRVLVLRLLLIAVIVTLSLNVINGYMGEFSCSHPGFMALGAYGASVMTVLFFVNDDVFGPPLLPPALGPFLFPVALIVGGLVASVGALLVAIPSFRTRGDYLAIISLAFTFIVKSLIENLEVVGGPRGFMNQPNWATLPAVFIVTILCVAIIHNFVTSTMGKALCAVRDDETAADAMTINTRRTKMTAFLFSAFWAGVGGGLLAHVLRYVNPGNFGILKLSEVLAMVYLGGLNSVVGSIVGAVGLQILMEALRPLEILRWIIIPVLLILVMIYRPTGLVAFTELDVKGIVSPKDKAVDEVQHGAAAD